MENTFDKYFIDSLNLLKNLISYKTVLIEYKKDSKDPFGKELSNCLNYLLDVAKKDGFKTINVDNYAGMIEYGSDDLKESIGILVHIDVVNGSVNSKYDPFTLTFEDDLVYGRGVIDDKGPISSVYYALKKIKDEKIKLNKKVQIIIGLDEETESRCLKYYFSKMKKPEIAFSPDAMFPVINGHKSYISLDVSFKLKDTILKSIFTNKRYNMVCYMIKFEVKKDLKKEFLSFLNEFNHDGKIENNEYIIYGKSAHAMNPSDGKNAIFSFFHFLSLYDLNNKELFSNLHQTFLEDYTGKNLKINIKNDQLGELSQNLGFIELNHNLINIGINYRVPVDNYFITIKNKFYEKFNDNIDSINLIKYDKSHFVSNDSKLVKSLLRVYQKHTNDYINMPYTIGGVTYAKFIDNCVAYGPCFVGSLDTAHMDNEYIKIDELKKSMKIYHDAIIELGKD